MKLFNLFFTDERTKRTQLYESHLGAHTYMHAMTPSPRLTVGEVARTVVEFATVAALRASEDAFGEEGEGETRHDSGSGGQYMLWLGVVLHAIMDSYTEAHAVRHSERELTAPSARMTTKARRATTSAGMEHVITLASALQTLASETASAPLTRREFDAVVNARIRGPTGSMLAAKSAYKGYLSLAFHKQGSSLLRALLPPPLLHPDPPLHRQHPYDIVTFSHYPSQTDFYHVTRDRLDLIEAHPAMYARMMDECTRIAELFRAHLVSPSSMGRIEFLERVSRSLSEGALCVSAADAGERSGRDYA
jgi:hypothetical protein